MTRTFPSDFLWGTATSAAQIESASDHQFRGLAARDGAILERTTDHELRRASDAEAIARFGKIYVCSLDWAALQAEAYASFDVAIVAAYRTFFEDLRDRGVGIVLSLHHFAHPTWFEQTGGWVWESNLQVFYDYADRVLDAFGDLIFAFNTFNEPNTYASHAYYRGVWPPYETNLTKSTRVAGNMGRAHLYLYAAIKHRFPDKRVGYTLGTASFEGRSIRGRTSASLADWWYYTRSVNLFRPTDYVGISYTAHVPFAPKALDVATGRDKLSSLGLRHDDLYALKPDELANTIRRAHRDSGKPVWVMANGVCTADDAFRQNILEDYLSHVYDCIQENVPVIGYNAWAPWDTFEWQHGPSYRYGLLRTDTQTLDRVDTGSARWYAALVATGQLDSS